MGGEETARRRRNMRSSSAIAATVTVSIREGKGAFPYIAVVVAGNREEDNGHADKTTHHFAFSVCVVFVVVCGKL